MEYEAIVSLIGSVGFPIVMCLMLFNYIKTEQSTTRELLQELKETIIQLTSTIRGKENDE